MFYEEIRIKQGLSYISFCPLRILYNSEFILMATTLGTNAVVVMRVHCTYLNFTVRICLPSSMSAAKIQPACSYSLIMFFTFCLKKPGPSCSKLTISLVNDLLKFTSSDTQTC